MGLILANDNSGGIANYATPSPMQWMAGGVANDNSGGIANSGYQLANDNSGGIANYATPSPMQWMAGGVANDNSGVVPSTPTAPMGPSGSGMQWMAGPQVQPISGGNNQLIGNMALPQTNPQSNTPNWGNTMPVCGNRPCNQQQIGNGCNCRWTI